VTPLPMFNYCIIVNMYFNYYIIYNDAFCSFSFSAFTSAQYGLSGVVNIHFLLLPLPPWHFVVQYNPADLQLHRIAVAQFVLHSQPMKLLNSLATSCSFRFTLNPSASVFISSKSAVNDAL
jgi:hypothetical protein